ncbi:MAG: amidohydrolase family protein [Planctomycetaceae bacterium]|nr:amidohydrolase family protein [Planctomycetaceae bacterium]
MHTITKTISSLAALAACATLAHAQSDIVPAKPQSRPVAVIHAVVHTARADTPVIEDGHVVFDGGRIVSIGAGMPTLPDGCEIVDAQGMHLSPGFVAMPTNLGLVETLQVEATDDRSEFGDYRPEAVPAVAINPDSDLLTVARAAGILIAVSVPNGGTVSGSASAIRLDGWTPEDIAIDRAVGVVMTWPMVEPARSLVSRRSPEDQKRRAKEELEKIGRFFDEMKAILAARAADPTVAHDERAEAMRDVLSGKDPVIVQVGSASQIESAVAWTKARGLRLVVVGGDGIEPAIPLLKAEKIPVVVSGVHRLPGNRHAPTDEAYALPRKLAEAGILFSIATADEPAHERNLPHHAATAAAFGLDREAALRAVTSNPCEIAGIGDRYGSLAPLKSATMILTRGHPLEITSDVAAAWIDGRTIDLSSHQTQMKRKYEEKLERGGK